MKHMCVILNEQTKLLDVVLKWPVHAPIGPRLEKRLAMPHIKATGYSAAEDAIKAAKEFDAWFERQENGGSEETVVAKPLAPLVPLAIERPKVTPPPPTKPKQDDMFADL